jgi:hypothetical protein
MELTTFQNCINIFLRYNIVRSSATISITIAISFWLEFRGNFILGSGLNLTMKRLGYSRHTEAVFFWIGQRIHVRGQEPKIVVQLSQSLLDCFYQNPSSTVETKLWDTTLLVRLTHAFNTQSRI